MSGKPPEPPPRASWGERNRQIREEFHGLDEICHAFRAEFAARAPIDYVTVLPQGADPLWVLISFKLEADVAASEASGLSEEMRAFVRAELAACGRKGEPKFDFNSLQQIGRLCGGYFNYLR